MSDKSRYKIIISGRPSQCKVANIVAESVKKMYLISFPFQPNDLNFKAKRGSSATNMKDIISVELIKKIGFNIKSTTKF